MTPNDMLAKANQTFQASTMSSSMKAHANTAFNGCKIYFNSRLKTKAGVALCSINRFNKTVFNMKIELNPALFDRCNADVQYNITCHEFAHQIDFNARLTSNHDAFWQDIHRACGGTAERTHQIDCDGLRNNVRRMVVFDTIKLTTHKITVANWNRIRGNPQYKLMRTEIYNGVKLLASQEAH